MLSPGCGFGTQRCCFADLVTGEVVDKLVHHREIVRDCSWHPHEQEVRFQRKTTNALPQRHASHAAALLLSLARACSRTDRVPSITAGCSPAESLNVLLTQTP